MRASPDAFVQSWALWRQLYLANLPRGQFYPTGLVESPTAHFEWIRDFEANARNLIAAPRGTAKSTVLGKELPLFLATCFPYSYITLTLATDRKVEARFDDFMQQFETNSLLIDDFGQMKPKRGTAIWNRHMLRLNNGSTIQGLSVDGRNRGERPTAIILDDPEYDPDSDLDETAFKRKMETLLFRVMLPMLDPGCRFMWIGTLISRRSAQWSAIMGDDKRFERWNRRIYALQGDRGKAGVSYMWRQKWGPMEVAAKKAELGPAAFEGECQNNPVSVESRTLPLSTEFNFYEVKGDKLVWKVEGADGVPEIFETDYDEWLSKLTRIFTVDPALSDKPGSDLSCVLCVGIDAKKWWWILDIFLGRISTELLTQELYKMGAKYQPPLIGIEAVGFQDYLRKRIEADMERETAGQPWHPKVWPIRFPPRMSKSSRIESLASKLYRHQIRLPQPRHGGDPINILIQQIRDFTPDFALLPQDDAVDALAMVPYCPRISSTGIVQTGEDDSIMGQIMAGRTTEKHTGLPLALFVNISELDANMIDELRYRRHKNAREDANPRHVSAQDKLRALSSPDQDVIILPSLKG